MREFALTRKACDEFIFSPGDLPGSARWGRLNACFDGIFFGDRSE